MHDFVEEFFQIENTFEYILSIQVSLNGFSFSILCPTNKKILVFKSVSLKISSDKLIARRLKEWYQSENILQKTFQKTRVIIFSNKFTIVPKTLHKNQLNDELAHILFKESSGLQFAENLIKTIDAKLLFTLPEDFHQIIGETIGECEITHPIKSLINNLPENTSKNSLILLFNDTDLFLVLEEDKKLLLANSFSINHANDAVYFVLTTLAQMEISAKNTKLYSAGKSPFFNDTSKSFEKYFSSVELFLPAKLERATKLSEKLIAENITLFI